MRDSIDSGTEPRRQQPTRSAPVLPFWWCSSSLSSSACSCADVSGKASFANCQNLVWDRSSFLAEYIEDYHGVPGNVIDDPPSLVLIVNPEFMALRADRRNWPRMRQTQALAFLQSAQQKSGLNPSRGTERRRFHLASQPNQRS